MNHIIDGNANIDNLPKDPENNEIFEYLSEFGHEFKSKHTDFLIVNVPEDYDKAVEAWRSYVKYADSDYNEREDIDTYEPIYIYCFNSISSLNSIYDGLQQVCWLGYLHRTRC